MKKIMMLLAITMFLLGVSGQAMATYFNDGDLIRVVYSATGGMETATDLTSVASLTSASTVDQLFSTNNFSIGGLGSGATFANSYVAYYSVSTPPSMAWVSGNAGGQTANNPSFQGFLSAAGLVNGAYQAAGGTSAAQVTVATSGPNSYYTALSNGTGLGAGLGAMNGFIPAGGTETNLANLANVGYVDQYLYYYTPGARGTPTGTELVDIRTYANGTTEFNATQVATPLPATFLLFGSGLLGLVGIRRKQSV